MENLVIEHEFLKKLLYISIPILIIISVYFFRTYQPGQLNFTYPLLSGIIFIVGGTILRFTSNISKKNFRYYYARACIQLSLKKTDEAEKMNLLVRALNSYNKYLKRILKLQIKNIDEICSKIILDPEIDKHEFRNSMNLDFQSDDKLKPTTRIMELLNQKNPEQFLTKESLWEKIKDWGALLAAIIPVVIGIIQFAFATFSKPTG